MKSIETSVYTKAVSLKTHSLRQILAEFRRESPLNTSQQFIRGVLKVIDAVDVFHANRMAYANTVSDTAFQDEQRRFYSNVCLQLLAQIHEKYLPLLYSARQQNQYVVLPSIRRAISIFQPDVELSLVPSFEFNYAFNAGLENFVENTISKLEQYMPTKDRDAIRAAVGTDIHPRWITFIHFPIVERDSALNLVILSHEIAHLIDQVSGLYRKLPVELEPKSYANQLDEVCKTRVANTSEPSGPQFTFEEVFTRAALEARFRTQCIATAISWIREIIADLIAVHGLGPAYFFAFSEVIAHFSQPNQPSSSHPAPAYRQRILLEELAFLRYFVVPAESGAGSMSGPQGQNAAGDTQNQSSESGNNDPRGGDAAPTISVTPLLLSAWQRVIPEENETKYSGTSDVAHATLTKYLDELRGLVRTTIGNYSFTSDKYSSSVPAVIEKLSKGIAPIEARDAAGNFIPNSVQAILNGGWELYKTNIDGFYDLFQDSTPKEQRLYSFNQLLFKAIESSEVVRLWQKA